MAWLLRGIVGGGIGYAVGWGLTAAVQSSLGTDPGGDSAFSIAYMTALVGWLMGVGMWRTWGRTWIGRDARYETRTAGLGRYLTFNTDHKVIGIQYLVTFVIVFILAGLLAMVIRWELMDAAATLSQDTYNKTMSLHGILMVAVAVAAILGGLGNFAVPLQIGARDMAFPRLNALSYWLIPPVAALLIGSWFAGGWDSGWTAYPPLSVQAPLGQTMYILAIVTFGLSSILGAVNSLTTITKMRAPGMTWGRIPIFTWSIFAASLISLLFTQFFAASVVMVLLDRTAGTVFFDATSGGKPLLYQHMFWFYSHPAVYVMIIPGFGVTLEILAHMSRKPLFGYRLAVGALLGIVGLSGVVWAHHMFTSGMASWLHAPFMALTELISIPTGVIFLCAIGTIWRGRLWLATPMLFALFVIANFSVGGITGIYLADIATDVHLQDTYFVVAHFHYTIVGGEIFALFAGLYWWYPKYSGRVLSERWGMVHAIGMFVGFNLTFMPLFMAGVHGMNRRINEYQTNVETANRFASYAAFFLGASFAVFLANWVWHWARGRRAVANPWGATTLEWTIASPPPPHDFDQIPTVVGDPYPYGEPGHRHAEAPAGVPAPIAGASE
jgi:cytochrome c oxidase subunit 1